jgi:hypothetical protein
MIEKISLEISNYWTSNDFLTETNKNCGTLVAFDWVKEDSQIDLVIPSSSFDWVEEDSQYFLVDFNTNIDLSDLEVDNFKFDVFVDFLRKNNFNQVLGLKNIGFKDNPSEEWTNKLKESLKSGWPGYEIGYDEYVIDTFPHPIPEFDVENNIFILRYSFDSYNKVDALAAHWFLFESFLKESDWKKYFNQTNDWSSKERRRVIVFCSNIENLVLHGGFDK